MREMASKMLRPAVFVVVVGLATNAQGGELAPRPEVIKPAQWEMSEHEATDRIMVKFHDDSPMRLRDGRLTDLGAGVMGEATLTALERVQLGTWRRAFDATSEEQL